MLTNTFYRSIVQNTKIKGIKSINKDLMKAIDYLIGDSCAKVSETKDEDIENQRRAYKMKKYTKARKKGKGEDVTEEQPWIKFAKTGKLKETEDAYEMKNEYQIQIAQEVRKPFEDIDLPKLKQEMIAKSIKNQMGIYAVYDRSKYDELYSIVSDAVVSLRVL
jgi:hypothetical protein